MPESPQERWQRRLGVAERAVAGEEAALAALREEMGELPDDDMLLLDATTAGHFAYWVALLREAGTGAEPDGALATAAEWVTAERVPWRHRRAVHNRLATVFAESGLWESAREALELVLDAPGTRLDKALTLAGLGAVAAHHDDWQRAGSYARQALRRTRFAHGGAGRLHLRMRATFTLFRAARAQGDDRRARAYARTVTAVCRQQIGLWGNDHPRALEALVVTAATRHGVAEMDGSADSMERLLDVLAMATQRAAAVLGARHPLTRSARALLDSAFEATKDFEAGEAAARRRRAHSARSPGTSSSAARQAPPRDAPRATGAGLRPEETGIALELLVHGVGGATPRELLDDARTVRITGDDVAAVFRRADDADAEKHPDRRDGRIREAYVWGDLTSGNGTRALWLLLLPFMVANLAHWMRPAARGGRRTIRLFGLLVRLVALSLTVLLVAAACEVALDLVAWQCAGTRACAERHTWLGFLSPAVAGGGWWSAPGRRLALAALVPTALTGLLWYLSLRTWRAYESQQPIAREPESDESGGPTALDRPGFWYGRRLVARLRAAHTAAGLLTVAAAVGGGAARYDREPGGPVVLEVLGRLLEGALLVGAAAVVWVVCRRGRGERRPDRELDEHVVRRLPLAALVLLALACVYAGWERRGWESSGRLPGDAVFGGIALAQGLFVIVLAVAAGVLYRTRPDRRAALRGQGGPAVATLACALGGVMSGGVSQRVSDWLDGTGESIDGPPVLLTWQASVILPLLTVLLMLCAWLARRARRLARIEQAVVDHDYPGEVSDPERGRRIASVRAMAALTDRAPLVVAVTAVATLLLGVGALAGALATGEAPGEAARGTDAVVHGAARTAQALGSWLIALGFVLFATWGRRAYKDAAARRTIGVLWDVGTFWPRAAHPFAPPCYAERAVPDLTWRIATWTRTTGGRLVISGHSQGSVLAAAAVWQLAPAVRRRVALLTHGSPLERLYGRWFPAHFGPAALSSLHREVDCWRNLYRLTDPIGGPVRVPGHDGPEVDRAPLKDPSAYGRTGVHPLPAPILGHSDYRSDPAFAEERNRLLARLRPAPPAPVAGSGRASPGNTEADTDEWWVVGEPPRGHD